MFWSRTSSSAEKSYSTLEKECPPVVWALTTLRPCLMGERFTVFSHQASLRWLLTITQPSGRLTRWRLRLSEFDFEVGCKKGIFNTQADSLYRLQMLGETASDIEDDILCFLLERDTIIHHHNLDFISQENAEYDAMLIANERHHAMLANFSFRSRRRNSSERKRRTNFAVRTSRSVMRGGNTVFGRRRRIPYPYGRSIPKNCYPSDAGSPCVAHSAPHETLGTSRWKKAVYVFKKRFILAFDGRRCIRNGQQLRHVYQKQGSPEKEQQQHVSFPG